MTDFEKQLNEFTDKIAKVVTDGVKIAKDVADEQAAKLKLKAEIGQNERDITKAYTRLGEAYYEAKTNNAEMSDVNDVVDLIRSKKKLVELLKEKLDAMNPTDDSVDNSEE